MINLHIAPVGLGPGYKHLKDKCKLENLQMEIKVQFVNGPSPIPVLTCPDTPELGLPSSHSLSYGFRSRPAFRRICPAPVCRITAPGILVQYAG